MTWSAFSRDPFQVQEPFLTRFGLCWQTALFRSTLKIKIQTPFGKHRKLDSNILCIKTLLHKNDRKAPNSYFPTLWDQLPPGINLRECEANCRASRGLGIRLEAHSKPWGKINALALEGSPVWSEVGELVPSFHHTSLGANTQPKPGGTDSLFRGPLSSTS